MRLMNATRGVGMHGDNMLARNYQYMDRTAALRGSGESTATASWS